MFPPVPLKTEGVSENLTTRMRKVKKGRRKIMIRQGRGSEREPDDEDEEGEEGKEKNNNQARRDQRLHE